MSEQASIKIEAPENVTGVAQEPPEQTPPTTPTNTDQSLPVVSFDKDSLPGPAGYVEDIVGDFGAGDLKLPILRIVQGQGSAVLGVPPGTVVLDNEPIMPSPLSLGKGASPQALRLIPLKMVKKFRERVTDPNLIPRVVNTQEEVTAAGGRLTWDNNEPPTWQPMVMLAALVAKPATQEAAAASHLFTVYAGGEEMAFVRIYLRGQQYKTAQGMYATAISLATAHKDKAAASISGYWWTFTPQQVKVQSYVVWTWIAHCLRNEPVDGEVARVVEELRLGMSRI